MIKYGLFAVKGRLFDKIIRKQIEVIQNLDHFLYEENFSGIVLDEDLRVLLKKMLALNPEKRISPTEIIEYLTEEVSSQEGQSTIHHK
jgi:dual specificity tyrosine-phosphorylation-regulated kinase 2/3/4